MQIVIALGVEIVTLPKARPKIDSKVSLEAGLRVILVGAKKIISSRSYLL